MDETHENVGRLDLWLVSWASAGLLAAFSMVIMVTLKRASELIQSRSGALGRDMGIEL